MRNLSSLSITWLCHARVLRPGLKNKLLTLPAGITCPEGDPDSTFFLNPKTERLLLAGFTHTYMLAPGCDVFSTWRKAKHPFLTAWHELSWKSCITFLDKIPCCFGYSCPIFLTLLFWPFSFMLRLLRYLFSVFERILLQARGFFNPPSSHLVWNDRQHAASFTLPLPVVSNAQAHFPILTS